MDPTERLKASAESWLSLLAHLEEEERSHDEDTNAAVRWVMDSFSGGRANVRHFHLERDKAREALTRVLKGGGEGDLKAGIAHLNQASKYWERYVRKNLSTAETAMPAVTSTGVSSTLAVAVGGAVGGPFGVALGLSIAAGGSLSGYIGLKSPAPKDPREEAIEAARNALKNWRNDRETSYTLLMLKGESADSQDFGPEKLRVLSDRWKSDMATIRKTGAKDDSPQRKLADGRSYLFRRYLSRYVRDSALINKMLNFEGGNCVTSAVTLASLERDSGIRLPPHQHLLLQSFSDHVQAVFYDEKTREIWDLLGGGVTKELKGRLDHPHVILEAYLRGQGEPSPLAKDELLFLKEDSPENPGFRHDEANPKGLLDFGGEALSPYSTEPIPEKTTLQVPHDGVTIARGGVGGRRGKDKGDDIIAEEAPPEWKYSQTLKEFGWMKNQDRLYFSNADDAEDFNSRSTSEAKVVYLSSFIEAFYREKIPLDELSAFLANAEQWKSVPSEELQKRASELALAYRASAHEGLAFSAFKKVQKTPNNYLPLQQSPLGASLRAFDQSKTMALQYLWENSEDALRLFNERATDQKSLEQILNHLSGARHTFLMGSPDSDYDSIRDEVDRCPNERGTIDAMGCKPESYPVIMGVPEDRVEVIGTSETDMVEAGPMPPPQSFHWKAPAESESGEPLVLLPVTLVENISVPKMKPKDPSEIIRISRETAIRLLIMGRTVSPPTTSEKLFAQWTPEWSQAFKKLNKHRQFSHWLSTNLEKILNHRDPLEFTMINPGKFGNLRPETERLPPDLYDALQ